MTHNGVSATAHGEGTRATILVVEDEGVIALDIQQVLIRLGYRVPDAAVSAEQAIAGAEAFRPDLVLMDIKLKGDIDGIEAAAMLRDRFDVPVVYLTSYADDATLARAKKTLPFGYLLKPFSDRELHTTIEIALHKHAIERQLVERGRWFSTTLQSIGEAVIATDRVGRIAFMNPVAEALTTWSALEAVGRPLSEVFRIVVDGKSVRPTMASDASRGAFSVAPPADVSLVTRAGKSILVHDAAAAVMGEDGDVLGGVVVFRDITERRQMEQRLAASERLASIGSVAATMAHEINNPLTYVAINVSHARSLASRIEAAGELTGPSASSMRDLRSALDDAQQGAEKVLQIATEIRRIASAGGAADRKIIDLPDVLDLAVKLTGHVIHPATTITRKYTVTPFVEASESQVTQVFVNLLSNAAYAMANLLPEGQRIAIATRTDEGGRAVVEIRDTGRGIPKSDLARLFEPFFTTKPPGAGTGLGLSICRSIVESLGGDIEAESEVGRGSTFRVAFPPAGPIEGPSSSPMRAAGARPSRILVIDDEPAMGAVVQRVLGQEYEVAAESDPRLALARIAESEPFDLVFCDLRMPGMSGVDVYEALAASNPDTARRVVFFSADTSSSRAQKLLAKIANPVLVKPFTAESLRAIVKDYR